MKKFENIITTIGITLSGAVGALATDYAIERIDPDMNNTVRGGLVTAGYAAGATAYCKASNMVEDAIEKKHDNANTEKNN